MAAMKWWGWGQEGVEFTHEDKPALAPFILEAIGVDVRSKGTPPLRFDQLEIPDPALPDDLWEALEQACPAEVRLARPARPASSTRAASRCATWSGSAPASLPRVPDVVVRPGSEDEVTAILEAAMRFDAVVIPFGGGSSISGSLEAPATETRPVISLDLERLNKVLEIDAELAAGARAGRRVRPRPRGAAQGARVHVRPLP